MVIDMAMQQLHRKLSGRYGHHGHMHHPSPYGPIGYGYGHHYKKGRRKKARGPISMLLRALD
jgi:hypothetical protein